MPEEARTMTEQNTPDVEEITPTEEEDAQFANVPNGGGK